MKVPTKDLKEGDVIIEKEHGVKETVIKIVIDNETTNPHHKYSVYVRDESGNEPVLISSENAWNDIVEREGELPEEDDSTYDRGIK